MRNKCLLIFVCILVVGACNNNDTNKKAKPTKDAAFIKKMAKAVAEHRDSSGLRFNYISALDSVGAYKAAIAEMDSLILKDRGNYGLWFKLAKINEHASDTAEAIRCYQTALKIYRSPDGLLALTNLFAETKNIATLALCEELDNLKMGREYDSYTNFFRGVYHARIGEKLVAINYFDKSIINNYTFIDAYMEKGFVLYDAKKFDDALSIFSKASSISFTFADAFYWQGKCFEAKGDKSKAIEQYQQALKLDNNFQQAAVGITRINRQ